MSICVDGETINAWKVNKSFNTVRDIEIQDETEVPTVAGEGALATDTGVVYISKDGVIWAGHIYLDILNRYTNIGKLTTSDGTTLKAIATALGYRGQVTAAIADRAFLYFIADGTETQLQISTYKDVDCANWDLYINSILDSSAYDDYAAAPVISNRSITLTEAIKKGLNTIELRATAKHASSTDYFLKILGASIQ